MDGVSKPVSRIFSEANLICTHEHVHIRRSIGKNQADIPRMKLSCYFYWQLLLISKVQVYYYKCKVLVTYLIMHMQFYLFRIYLYQYTGIAKILKSHKHNTQAILYGIVKRLLLVKE